MEETAAHQRQHKTWSAAAHVSRSFELYREKCLFQRLDVWPLLLLLLLCSTNTVYELSSIAQQQAALQQRRAAAVAARCVKTADPLLLIFHAPHTSTFAPAQAAAALQRKQRLESKPETSQRKSPTRQQEEGATAAKRERRGDAEEVKKTIIGETMKQQKRDPGEEETAEEDAKRRNKNREEENELFPVLSWLFSSLWFMYTLALLFCGGLLHLSTHWWVRMKTLLGSSRVSSVRDATHVLVVPSCSGDVEPETLCKIEKLPNQIFFYYRKKKYLFDHQHQRFVALHFPKDLPIRDYFDWRGLGTAASPLRPVHRTKERTTAAAYARSAWGGERETHKGVAAAAIVASRGANAAVERDENFPAGHEDAEPKGRGEGRESGDRYLSPYWTGTEGDRMVSAIEQKYGRNEYDIPIPSFGDLFKEHAVAPFFVFQVFSISLWLLDEYWHYSVMMLVMLLFLECQMVKKRLKDFHQLRSMRMPPFPVSVYRSGAWTRLPSDQLLPGDIFALSSRTAAGDGPLVCPVDALLLQGTVVANEATLTGESVPQTKVALDREADGKQDQGNREKGDTRPEEGRAEERCVRLDMKQRHKHHVVFAGTSVLLHANEQATFRNTKVPEKSCVAFVLRTGFSTSQGKLVRTILFSHGRVTVSSREAWYFLGILLLLAVGASAYVVHATLADALVLSRRRRFASRFKLFLACSHIVMAVVPAEFPITLSLAVTMSLISLVTKKIFCTEPFRVPYAGQVDICCFDKTGTLTSDSMRVHGVYGMHMPAAPELCAAETGEGDEHAEAAGGSGDAAAALPWLGRGNLKPLAAAEEEALNMAERESTEVERRGETGAAAAKESEKEKELAHSRLLQEHVSQTLERQSLPFDTTAVVGCCHTLAPVEGQLLGDPMEKAAFCSMGWQLLNPDTAVTTRSSPGASNEVCQDRLTVLKRFPFTSELQRMFVIARHEGPAVPWCGAAVAATWNSKQRQEQGAASVKGGTRSGGDGGKAGDSSRRNRLLVAGKGSPEVMRALLAEIPPFYDALCKHFCLQGYRVLTLAVKEYACREGTAREQEVLQQLRDRRRVEESLTFAGVLVLTCPIKKHTKEHLYFIRAAGHRVVIITGDNPLTACQVARELGIVRPPQSHGQVPLGCSEGNDSLTEQHRENVEICGNVEEKQQQHSKGLAGKCGFSQELAYVPVNTDSRGSITFRHVLILNAKEQFCVADVCDPARSGGAGGSRKTLNAAPTVGRAAREDTPVGRHDSAERKSRESDSIRAAPRGTLLSTSQRGAPADETTTCAAARFAALQAVDAEATEDRHAPQAAAVASLPFSFGSVRRLFYWESPEGRIVAKASLYEALSDALDRFSRVSGDSSSPSAATASQLIPGASCFVAASGGRTVSTLQASCAAFSSGAPWVPRSSSSSSFGESSSFNRSDGEASRLAMPRWLAPVLSVDSLAQLAASYELCVTGAALDLLLAAAGATTPQRQVRLLRNLVPFVAVYARMSPQQKELVLVSMNSCGHITLMCGDGTNDVGALKAAHVGVSLLCHKNTEKEDSQSQKYDSLTGRRPGSRKNSSNGSGTLVPRGSRRSDRTNASRGSEAGVGGPTRTSVVKWQSSLAVSSNASCPQVSDGRTSNRTQRWQTYLEEALEQAEAAEDPPIVRLGDASVASPFTYKGDSIHGVRTILRAGRATLVTVVMMYKLMALNSVVTAFSLSVLTLDGVKLGDLQTTLENLLCTVLTLLISKAQPTVENMSTYRPIASVFHPVVLLSLIGQAAIHCFTLYASWALTRADRRVDWDPDIDGPFEPNLVNTVVFLLIASMHASTFLSNYEGAPFMKSLGENRPFCVTLGILLCSLIVLVLEIFPDFNAWLGLVPFPSTACKLQVIQLVTVDILGSWAVGWSTRKLGCWCACNRTRLPKVLQ